jgi:hypothetical protein
VYLILIHYLHAENFNYKNWNKKNEKFCIRLLIAKLVHTLIEKWKLEKLEVWNREETNKKSKRERERVRVRCKRKQSRIEREAKKKEFILITSRV